MKYFSFTLPNSIIFPHHTGIMLDLEEDSPAKLQALTVDELQKKLETIFQKDLSDR